MARRDPGKTETRQRDLHTGTPLWASSPHIALRRRGAPSRDLYDVIVVGAGISGALVAHALTDGRRRVLMVDRRPPVTGSSLASTAMIQHEIDVPLHRLARQVGRERAARAWRRSARAVEELTALATDAGIRCGMSGRQALYLAGDDLGARALRSEAELRQAAGLDATFLDGAELLRRYGIERSAAIVSTPSAAADPAQLTAGLIRAAQRRGLELVGPLEIADVMPIAGQVTVASAEGRLLAAGQVVFCSGYEFLQRLQSPRHQIVSTWAIAARPKGKVPAWLRRFLVWEASDPYLYARMTRNGSLIAGGEDEDSETAHEDADRLAAKAGTIAAKLEALLPVDLAKPHRAWAGAFGTTTTGLPLIGAVPGLDNVYAAMGFGGNGITFSKIAADIVAAAVAGKADPDADLFAFGKAEGS